MSAWDDPEDYDPEELEEAESEAEDAFLEALWAPDHDGWADAVEDAEEAWERIEELTED